MMATYRELMLRHYSFTLRSRAEVLSLRFGDRKHGHFYLALTAMGTPLFGGGSNPIRPSLESVRMASWTVGLIWRAA